MSQKIVEINPEGQGIFCEHLAYLAKAQGWDFQFENRTEFANDILKNSDIVKVTMSLAPEILPQLSVVPTLVRTVGSMDCFIREDGQWYPRLLFYEALREVLVSCAHDLDNRAPAFVVGQAEEARVVAAVFAEMGFNEIYMVGEDVAALEVQAAALRRSQFGIRFVALPVDELTIQSVSAAIVVNTVDLSNNKPLLVDLSYFNYMKQEGYVLDLNLRPFHNSLLDEAEKAELKVLHPVYVAAALTFLWLEKMKIENSLTVDDLRESWKRFLAENSPSV